jgi:hypothetical protein
MKKFDLPLILDIIFIFFASLFVSFTVLRYYLDSLTFVTIISFLISFLSVFIGYKLIFRKQKNIYLKNEELAKKNEIFFNLAFLSENDLKNYFIKLFLKAEIKAEKTKEGILLTERNQLVRFMFKLTPLNIDDFVATVKSNFNKDIILITDEVKSEVLSYAKKTEIKIVTGTNLFLLMKKHDLYPEISFTVKANEKIVKRRFNIELTRKKAKNFLLFGSVLLLFSMFVAFPIYYLVMGNILIITSVILRFYGKKPENTDTII